MAIEDIMNEGDINPSGTLLTTDELEAGPGDSKGLRNRQNRQPHTNKRYLDDTERILQGYDMNNDGSLDAQEAKKIARDLAGQKNEKNMMKKLAGAAVTAVSIVLLANVGLVLAT